jgi:MFS transporter, DHA1 family, tetracycline resistance protein
MTLVFPLLAIYAESFHATPLQATMLVTVYAGCQLVSGPLIGYASDRIGRKPMLIFSQIGTFIGFIILARATALWMIYLSRVIDGATAGNLSLAQAYIADNTPPEDRAKAFGLIGIAFGLGFFIGPSITGFLSAKYGLNAPIYLAAAMSAVSVIATATLLRGGKGHSSITADRWAALRWDTYTQYFSRPALRTRLMQYLFYMMSFSMFISGFALFAERRYTWNGHPFGPREIGYIFGGIGLLGIILQGGLIGRLVKRYGEASLVVSGFATLVLGYFLLGATMSGPLLFFTAIITGYGNSVIRPALTSLISHQAGSHEQGTVLGVSQALMSGASIVIPLVSGVLIGRDMLAAWCWTTALFAGIGWVLSIGGVKESPGLKASPA